MNEAAHALREVQARQGIPIPADPQHLQTQANAVIASVLKIPLRDTILAVLTSMPAEALPEHLAAMIESQVRAWVDLQTHYCKNCEGIDPMSCMMKTIQDAINDCEVR